MEKILSQASIILSIPKKMRPITLWFCGSAFRHSVVLRSVILFLYLLIPAAVIAWDNPSAHLTTFGTGTGPFHQDNVYHLLDGQDTYGQSNAVAFDVAREGAYENVTLRCSLRILAGGDGGSFVLLNTSEYGKRGPAPFVKSWAEPNLTKTFAVGIDVHNPPNNEPFGPWGNYLGMPEREISLHWDGREIVKRLAPVEFRGNFTELEIIVHHVIGGAEVTVRISGEALYDRFFVAGMLPYETRLAIGAGTRGDATTEFDIKNLLFSQNNPSRPQRPPKHVQVFNHIRIGNAAPSYEKEITLPPLGWAYGRLILTLQIHDSGADWEKWDQSGHLYIVDSNGDRHDIVQFITSFRTPCHWKVDVTHFRPWLAGKVKFGIETGTSSGRLRAHFFCRNRHRNEP